MTEESLDEVSFFDVCGGPIQVIYQECNCKTIEELKEAFKDSFYGNTVLNYLIQWSETWKRGEIFQGKPVIHSPDESEEHFLGESAKRSPDESAKRSPDESAKRSPDESAKHFPDGLDENCLKWSDWQLYECKTIDDILNTCVDYKLFPLLKWCKSTNPQIFQHLDWREFCIEVAAADDLDTVQWFLSEGLVSTSYLLKTFEWNCLHGALKVCQWLLSLGLSLEPHISKYFEERLYQGDIRFAIWMMSVKEIREHISDEILMRCFRTSLYSQRWPVTKWLWQHDHANKQTMEGEMRRWFFNACESNCLSQAQGIWYVNPPSQEEIRIILDLLNTNSETTTWLQTKLQ